MLLFYQFNKNFWKIIIFSNLSKKYKWFNQTFSLQLKYFISWIFGYFIFQFMVPTTLTFMGPKISGQLGMSLSIVNAVMFFSAIWLTTKIPYYGLLAGNNDHNKILILFKNNFKKSILTYLFGILGTLFICGYIFPILNWQNRILNLVDIFILLIAYFAHLISMNYAICLRAYKEEPFVLISVIAGIGSLIIIYFSLKLFSSINIMLLLYSMFCWFMIIPAYFIFKNKMNSKLGKTKNI